MLIRSRKRERRIALICAILTVIACSALSAQIRFAVEIDPRLDTGKLAPDLYVAQRTGATFLGITPEGAAVLEYPADMDEDAIVRALANVEGVREAGAHGGQPFERLTQVVVGHLPRDPDYEPGELFSGQSIAGVLPAASFVVIESREGFSSSQLAELEANNTVVYADPNYSYQLSRTPNDQYFYNQWGMKTGTPRINATSAWDHVTSSDIVVAVVDTGVKYDHPDLDANIWVNKVEQQGDPMLDDDRNGYLNDIHGIDLVLKTGNPMDKSGHGTHCAGVIGAEGDNDKVGVAGVCWMVRIMAIRVFEYSKSKAPAATLAEAIYYAANNGAQVVNCSWGGYKPNDAIKAAIDYAEKKGCLVVCAAGNGRANAGGDNDLDPFFPASYPMRNIISVLAIDESGALPKLSNYGYHSVDLGAPGISVYSTLANVPYGYASGTSMATPHVSGAAALIWNYPQPGKSYADVKKELLDGAMKLSTLYQRCVTGGTLDLTFVQ